MAATMTTERRPDTAAELEARGWLRLRNAVEAHDCERWIRLLASGDPCPVSEIVARIAEVAAAKEIDWWDESVGLPEGPAFILDLEDRPSAWGGLLMVPDADRFFGWRPEAGTLSLFRTPFVISPLVPGAPRRRAMLGRMA